MPAPYVCPPYFLNRFSQGKMDADGFVVSINNAQFDIVWRKKGEEYSGMVFYDVQPVTSIVQADMTAEYYAIAFGRWLESDVRPWLLMYHYRYLNNTSNLYYRKVVGFTQATEVAGTFIESTPEMLYFNNGTNVPYFYFWCNYSIKMAIQFKIATEYRVYTRAEGDTWTGKPTSVVDKINFNVPVGSFDELHYASQYVKVKGG